ncbi:MAG: hypothetical protein IT305_16530 [Chloroflexi bacterium]|nr:hypothetical protein [Chloroflexota bacterium]
MNQPAARQSGTDRFLLAIVAGAILLVVAGVVAAIVVGRPSPAAQVDPTSPSGVVQAYLEALRTGDYQGAESYLTDTARASLQPGERRPSYVPNDTDDTRIVVETVSMTDDRAEVKVTFSRFTARSDPFSANTWHRDVTVRLLREAGVWRISQPAAPWPYLY